ncbi:MAG: HEAT repeat domain-containing protein, partial [Phycisphaerae bacterium]|nr:HEAT repeat domain-containing protein [Phycisphaerae bacterium]
ACLVAPVLAGAPEAGEAEKAEAEETKKPLTAEEKAKRIEEMIDALAEEATRVPAERELTEFGEDAIPHLIKRLGDRKMSAHVGVLLEKLGEPAYQAIAVAMRDESSRNSAAMLMERVGEPAVPYLIEELERIGSRLRAGKALERIGDASVPALMKALRSPVDPKKGRSGWVAVRVVDALAKIGTPKVIDELMKALPDDALRSNGELTLSKLGPVAVNALMQRGLKDSNAAARATSIRLLYRGKVENAFDPILSLFSDPDVKVRREVAYACREYRRKEALPKLIAALKDKDRDVRAAALGAMVAIPDKSAINALVEAMKDVSLRMTAASAIEAMGAAAADHLLVMAKNQDKEIRWQALDALVPLKDVRAIPLFAVALGDKSRRVYLTSASGLRLVGEPATPALIGLLKSPDAIVRRRSADVLFNIKDARALDALVTLLKDKDDDVRVAGARAIIKLRDSRVVPALSAAMKDPNPDVRYQVTRALASVADKRTVPVLIEAMADPRMHQSILLAMERIGSAAESDLTAALGNKDRHIRGQAARCLGRIRIKTAPPKLIATLKDLDRDARKYAAEALGKIRDKSATPGLMQAASDKDASVRYNTVEALITIQDPRAIDTLVRALGDKMTRISAMSALGRIGQESVPALLSELKVSKKIETRRAIVDVLEGLDDPRAVPALVDALADEKIRQSAALSLGRIGKVALPNVVAALKSKDGSTRIGAAIALRDIASADAINAMAKAIK